MSEMNTDYMLPVGTVLRGTYRIDEYLSSGGFGNTYVATNVHFDERVAIKEFFMRGINGRDADSGAVSVSLDENSSTFKEQREKFKKEARRLRKLDSEHIVAVHDFFEENCTAYYVMDYIEGENLSERLKRTGVPMSEDEVLSVLRQVLDALEVAHNADETDGKTGILHLDIKPANIMMDSRGKVKLIDFGASKQLSDSGGATTHSVVCYTSGYAPLEQMVQDLKKFGPWTDIYSLGATLYTLLTSKQPPLPSAIDDDDSLDKHNVLPFPATVSDNTRNLILKMMQTNRRLRPQTVAEVKMLLVTPSMEPTPIPGEKWLLASCIIVTIALIAGLVMCSNSESEEEALYAQGKLYMEGTEVEADTVKAFSCFTQAAEMGYAEAQTTLGDCYYFGEGVALNYTTAVEWYRKAAEQGHSGAQHKMGLCYFHGWGVKCDLSTAVEWFRKATKQGYTEAMGDLGYCYYYGYGVTLDKATAVHWYEKAAEQGHAISQFYLGRCYEDGDGITKDTSKALEWYRKAASNGEPHAQAALKRLE